MVVVLSLASYLLAHRMGINALAGISVSPLLLGMVVYLWGWRAGQVLAFPIGFLAFGLASIGACSTPSGSHSNGSPRLEPLWRRPSSGSG
jgi:hypothetical protein